ncbi:MAG TPA: hypothetical protein VGD62_10840 [Acidobacteriaceae bacterium]
MPIARLAAVVLLACGFATSCGDEAVFLTRQRQGVAVASITVRQYLATPLKNGRDELDLLGQADQPCVRAILPHRHLQPCWWVRRHKDRWVQS